MKIEDVHKAEVLVNNREKLSDVLSKLNINCNQILFSEPSVIQMRVQKSYPGSDTRSFSDQVSSKEYIDDDLLSNMLSLAAEYIKGKIAEIDEQLAKLGVTTE